ncbi:MAG: hypothetical protein AABX60_02865, partial [Nanoarchaeota archaeon]
KGESIKNRIMSKLKRRFAFVPWAPVIFISAKNKKNTYEILNLAIEIMNERKKRISTPELNGFLQKITQRRAYFLACKGLVINRTLELKNVILNLGKGFPNLFL